MSIYMKVALGLVFALLMEVNDLQGGTFIRGNLAIYRTGVIGDGTNPGATADRVFIDEYTPTGVFVQSIPLPFENPAAGQHRLLAQGGADFEGRINRTADGQYLVLAGYDTALGTASPAAANATTVPRVVGRIDWQGTIDTSTRLTDWTSGASPRSVISSGGTNFFLAGGDGVKQTTLGGTSSTLVTNTVAGDPPTSLNQLMAIDMFGGGLYVSTRESGPNGVLQVDLNTGLMHGLHPIPGGTSNGDTHQFFMADLSSDIAGMDTIYVTDNRSQAAGGGLRKWTLGTDGLWEAKGGVFGAPLPGGAAVSALRGLTGAVDENGHVTLFGIRNSAASGSAGAGQLLRFFDNTGYDGTMSGIAVLLATAPVNTRFMGLDFVPVPEPASFVLVALAAGFVSLGRRTRGAHAPC